MLLGRKDPCFDDHVDALIKIMLNGEIGTTYCIGGSYEITNIELVKKICSQIEQISSNNIKSNIVFINDRLGHDRRYAIDSSRIRNELGWRPKCSFDINLNSTISWYLDNLKWTQNIKNRVLL